MLLLPLLLTPNPIASNRFPAELPNPNRFPAELPNPLNRFPVDSLCLFPACTIGFGGLSVGI
jgi:hypothetical protein